MNTGSKILETERLALRLLRQEDKPQLAAILQDDVAMCYYSHHFTGDEVQEWLDRQLARYANDGFGLWAVCLKETGEMIGQCGPSWQMWGEKRVPEIGYLLRRAHWHRGYATEAAIACKMYAFKNLGFDEVYSLIRDTNYPSQAVARRNGMRQIATFVKWYYGMEMPHQVWRAGRDGI